MQELMMMIVVSDTPFAGGGWILHHYPDHRASNGKVIHE
jgi:hypothetical protein